MVIMHAPADNYGIKDLLPELSSFLGDLQFYMGLFLLAGPILMLAIGIWRFFLPAKEANHKVGYRTFFGMGSVRAWRFTQWLSGMVWAGIGLLLTILAVIQCIRMGNMDTMDAATNTFTWLIVEGVCLLLANVAIEVVVAMYFDKDGNPRKALPLLKRSPMPARRQEAAKDVPMDEEPQLQQDPQDLFTQEDFFNFDELLEADSIPTPKPKDTSAE